MTSLSVPLKDGFTAKVKVGDKVLSGQVIAEKRRSGTDHEIHLRKVLNIPPEKISKHLLKRPGDKVDEGTIVAEKKGALGMGSRKAVSPVSGTVFKFDEETGILLVRSTEESQNEDIFAPVDGEVKVCDNEQITIESDEKTQEKKEVSTTNSLGKGKTEAQIFAIEKDDVSLVDISLDVEKKIVVGKNFDRESVAKSLGLGAAGIIAQSIDNEYLGDLKRRMVNTPILILGKEEVEKFIKKDGEKIIIDMEKKRAALLHE